MSMYFHYFIIISPWKKARNFMWTKLNPHSPKDALCQDWLKRLSGYWVFQCIFAIWLLSPILKGQVPSFEKSWYPITKGCFVPSLVEIHPLIFENILKICQCILDISLLSPLTKRPGPSYELKSLLPKNNFCQTWFKIGPVVLEKIFKAQQFFAFLAFGSGELKITHFHCMNYMAMRSKTNPCPRGHEIYNLGTFPWSSWMYETYFVLSMPDSR